MDEKYEFMKEFIKEKPLDKKRVLKVAGWIAGAAVLFGTVAAFTFAAVKPKAEEMMKKPKEQIQVNIPKDEEPEKTEMEEPKEEKEPEKEPVQESAENTQPVVQPVEKELTLTDYQKFYEDMTANIEKVKPSIVTVIGSKNNEDWFQTPYESEISGLLVADTGQDYFVLTEYRIVKDVDRIQVVFCDGTMVDGRFQKTDENTGLTILKISVSEVPKETRDIIAVAPLGNSHSVKQGQPVVAIGSPMGYSDSVADGIVASTTNKVSRIDAEYGLLMTDITGSDAGSGVIVNLNGEVVGVIAQKFSKNDVKNIIVGIPISQTKELIETLSNNKDIPYLGITGQTITSDISEKKGIPKGVFVEGVVAESPAMKAGIQNGDVITMLDGEGTQSLKEFQQKLKTLEKGQIVEVKAMRQAAEGYVEISFNVTLSAR